MTATDRRPRMPAHIMAGLRNAALAASHAAYHHRDPRARALLDLLRTIEEMDTHDRATSPTRVMWTPLSDTEEVSHD